MIQQPLPPQNNPQEDEIDLIALAKTAYSGRRTIITITLIFMVIGLFIALFSPKEYEAKMLMITQSSSGQSNSGLSSLAALAGVNLNANSTGGGLNAAIYPLMIQSIPFQKELMHEKLNFNGYKEKISLYDYYTDPKYKKFNAVNFVKEYTLGLPNKIIGIPNRIIRALRGKADTINRKNPIETDINLIQLSGEERVLIGILSSAVSLSFEKDGTIAITAIMPEAKAAAQLGMKAQDLLQEEIIKFNIAQANEQLAFVQERYNEKKKEFEEAQTQLAMFHDKNKNITTAIAKTEVDRLQNEYQLVFSVYTELAKQLENSKIQLKKETPIFSIIEPISIPVEYSKPNRKQIIIIWIFLGVIIGIGWVFGKAYLRDIRKRWNEVE